MSSRSRILTSLALLVTITSSAAPAQVSSSGLRLPPGAQAAADGTARTVGSILAYSHWPIPPDPVRLCVVGPATYAGRLFGPVLPGNVRISRRDVTASADFASSCDALYIGALGLAAMRQLTARARGRRVVTIAENDPPCRSEAMFCLVVAPGDLSFQINADAISRSGVRIDPRVLRMGRSY